MKRLRWLLAGAWLAALGWAAPRADANPSSIPRLTPQAGQWLVCAASYTGPESADLATQLATWIKGRYNTPVYLFNRSDEERKRLNDEYAARGLKKTVRVEDQYAVLVGGYADIETASKARDVIRKWPLPDLKLASGKPAFDMETTFKVGENGDQKVAETKPINPFASAMPIKNPLGAKAAQQKFDPLLTKLNGHEEHSLLRNPKPWTLAVKQYNGGSIVTDQQATPTLWDKLFGASQGQALDVAEKQSQDLARVLRKLGFEAWVLHLRGSSVVSVGGYDRADDPEMEKMRGRLKQLTQQIVANDPQKRDLFQLFAQPLAMEVPRPDK